MLIWGAKLARQWWCSTHMAPAPSCRPPPWRPSSSAGPSPMHPQSPSFAEHSTSHHLLMSGQRRCTLNYPGLRIAKRLAIVRTRSSLHAFGTVTHLPWKRTPISADSLRPLCNMEPQNNEHWLYLWPCSGWKLLPVGVGYFPNTKLSPPLPVWGKQLRLFVRGTSLLSCVVGDVLSPIMVE